MPIKTKDFIPDSWKNIRDWCDNIISNASVQLSGVQGWDGPRIAAFLVRIAAIRDAAQNVLNAKAVFDDKIGDLDAVIALQLTEVRKDIGNFKTSRGWDDGRGEVLDVNTPTSQINPNNIKPRLEVESKLGRNEIMAKKLGADSLNIYSRPKGTGPMTLIASKRVRFPMDDDAPSPDGKPQEREYQAIAVIGDDEVGQPSDIVSCVFRPV